MRTFASPLVAACLSFPALAGVEEPPKTNSSLPIEEALLSEDPYALNGLVIAGDLRGSGFVASHPNLFFTAAHVLYDDMAGKWSQPPEWFGAYHGESMPGGESIPSRGYFRWTRYADLVAASGVNSRGAFARDVALAWGLDPFTDREPAQLDLKGFATLKKPNASMITGYPASILYTGEAGNFFLHATQEDFTPYRGAAGRYLYATHISTGPGNSGGPVWVRDAEGAWKAGGVLVSGRPSETGVYAMSSEIKSFLKAAAPVLPETRRSTKNVSGISFSSKTAILTKPRTIPDGRHKWTKIPLKFGGFPEGSSVSRVRLSLTITTAHRGDLIVGLAGPGGMFAMLHDGEGAGEHDLVIDDIDLSGDFAGAEGLANGKWQLMVQDRLTGDIAVVTRFELEIGAD